MIFGVKFNKHPFWQETEEVATYERARGDKISYIHRCLPQALKAAKVFALAGLAGGLVNGLTENELGDWGRFGLSVVAGCLVSALGFGRGSDYLLGFSVLGALGGACSFGANKLFS